MTRRRMVNQDMNEARIRAAVIDLVEAIDVEEVAREEAGVGRIEDATPIRVRRPRGVRHSALVAGTLAAVLVVLTVLFIPSASNRATNPATGSGWQLFPEELPAYRPWRLPQSWNSLSDVAVTYSFRPDHEFGPLDAPHQVLLGADLSTTRHFDISDAPWTRVSPNGRRLASLATDDVVRVDDLGTDTQATSRIPRERPGDWLDLRAWAPDSARLYVVVDAERDTSAEPVPGIGNRLWEVTIDGRAREVPGTWQLQDVAAAPGGIRLAVVRADGRVDVIDRRDGRVLSSPVGPAGLSPLARIDPAQLRKLDPYAATEVLHDRHAPVTVMWSSSGERLVSLEYQSAESGRGFEVLRGVWEGTVARIVDATTGATRVLRLPRYHCRPLAMLSETSLLCESSARTPTDDSTPSGMTVLNLETGEKRVVARFPSVDNGVRWTTVAADLARSWRFSVDQPWVEPPLEP